MALTARQTRFYQDRASVYRRVRIANGDWKYEIVHTNIPCRFIATMNSENPTGGFGQLKQDNFFTFDRMRTSAEYHIDGGDMVKVLSGEHADEWYVTMGAGSVYGGIRGRVNTCTVLLNLTTAPRLA